MCEQVSGPSIRLLSFILSASKSSEKPHQVNISLTCKDLNEEFIFDIRLISALHWLLWSWTSHWKFDTTLTLNEKWRLTNVDIIGHLEFPPCKPRCLSSLFQDVNLIRWDSACVSQQVSRGNISRAGGGRYFYLNTMLRGFFTCVAYFYFMFLYASTLPCLRRKCCRLPFTPLHLSDRLFCWYDLT